MGKNKLRVYSALLVLRLNCTAHVTWSMGVCVCVCTVYIYIYIYIYKMVIETHSITKYAKVKVYSSTKGYIPLLVNERCNIVVGHTVNLCYDGSSCITN